LSKTLFVRNISLNITVGLMSHLWMSLVWLMLDLAYSLFHSPSFDVPCPTLSLLEGTKAGSTKAGSLLICSKVYLTLPLPWLAEGC
jgi:hypothetical protein